MQSPPRLMLVPAQILLKTQLRAGAVPRLWTPSHGLLLCPLEYDIEAAQEKDRQAFKPSNILQTQKTNCDGYAGLFEKMCRYQRVPPPSKVLCAFAHMPALKPEFANSARESK